MKRYFAYGSNMDATQMKERCPQSKKKETAELLGYQFFINKRGVANIRQNGDKKVLGIVYDISEDDEKELDKHEGVQFGTNTQEKSLPLNAFYYVAKEIEEGSPREGYLERIIKAGQENNFSEDYIYELKQWQK